MTMPIASLMRYRLRLIFHALRRTFRNANNLESMLPPLAHAMYSLTCSSSSPSMMMTFTLWESQLRTATSTAPPPLALHPRVCHLNTSVKYGRSALMMQNAPSTAPSNCCGRTNTHPSIATICQMTECYNTKDSKSTSSWTPFLQQN